MSFKEQINGERNDSVVEMAMASDRESAATEVMDIIDFEGPTDPYNPLNWPKWKTGTHVALVSVINFLVCVSPLSFNPQLSRY
jgi:hypothetical protein